jgi:hypothetical protein
MAHKAKDKLCKKSKGKSLGQVSGEAGKGNNPAQKLSEKYSSGPVVEPPKTK